MTIDPSMSLDFVLVVVIGTLLALFVLGALIVWTIIKVRDDPPPVMLTVVIGVLTLVTIVCFMLTKQNVLATLAGTGLGALSASLTNVFANARKPNPPVDPPENTEGDSNGSDPE